MENITGQNNEFTLIFPHNERISGNGVNQSSTEKIWE